MKMNVRVFDKQAFKTMLQTDNLDFGFDLVAKKNKEEAERGGDPERYQGFLVSNPL